MSDIKVRIKDYQIIKDATLTFVDGLNAIVGPSNNGKSAILRAMEAALFHKAGDDFIRLGTDQAQVVMAINGHKIHWIKGRGDASYIIDGQEFKKLGRSCPPEVASATQIKEINILDLKERINFWKQMDYPFLLDKSPSQLFSFLAFSSEQDKLTSVFARIKEDAKIIERNISQKEGAIDSTKLRRTALNDEIQGLEKIEQTITDILTLDAEVQNYIRLDQLMTSAKATAESILQIRTELTKTQTLLTKVDYISGIHNDIESISALRNLLTAIKTKKETINSITIKIDNINKINIPDCTELLESIKTLKPLIENIKKIENTIGVLTANLKSNTDNLDIVDSIVGKLGNLLVNIDSLKKTSLELKTLLSNMSDIRSLVEDYKVRIKSIDSDLVSVDAELAEFKVCPLCGQEGREHIHA